MFDRDGRALVVLLGATLVAMTAGSVVAPPSPISTATAAALVATACEVHSETDTSGEPGRDRCCGVTTRAARRAVTKIVLNPGHNGGNWSHPGAIGRQVPAGFGTVQETVTPPAPLQMPASPSMHSTGMWRCAYGRSCSPAHHRDHDAAVGPRGRAMCRCAPRIGNQVGVAGVVSIHADGALSSGHGFHVSEASRRPHGAEVAAASHRLTVAVPQRTAVPAQHDHLYVPRFERVLPALRPGRAELGDGTGHLPGDRNMAQHKRRHDSGVLGWATTDRRRRCLRDSALAEPLTSSTGASDAGSGGSSRRRIGLRSRRPAKCPCYYRARLPLRVTAHANRTSARAASPMSSELQAHGRFRALGAGRGTPLMSCSQDCRKAGYWAAKVWRCALAASVSVVSFDR